MSERPITILIAALGGEGGGVLTDWIVEAALNSDLPVQATSIPGVAQRTGATTYYVELFPETNAALGGRRPLFGLYPSPGGIDLMLASEVLEAGRALENGFVTPDRTTLATATHRIYAILEKAAMADGRFDTSRILEAGRALARKPILFDLTRSPRTRSLSLNAVLLGIAASCGVLPIPRAAFEEAIRGSGIAVDANLAAFGAGWEIGANGVPAELAPADDRAHRPVEAGLDSLIGGVAREFAPAAVPIIEEGVRRLADYQDIAYARLYYERLRRVVAVDLPDGALVATVARYLALWMSYEDVIRVADLKTRAERFAKLRAEIRAKPGEPVHVTEFLKPGIDEVSAVLPRIVGRALERWATRHGLRDRLHVRMRLKSTSVNGFVRLWLLARMRPLRRRSFRFAEEQRGIEQWLDAIVRAAPRSRELACEVAELARILKGYSDTHRRARDNYRRIFDSAVTPLLLQRPEDGAPILRKLREAALADPEGTALDQAFASAFSPAVAKAAE
ncbi:MAG TPA: indolepyruvate oxidoreductase subunit beta family protein [Stellaceae bacterium]|nr:indolepyruvate oxidoreductase subunit beta family protein [Stellaceae bacterium]